MTAHTAIIFTRYMILSVENREAKDERSLGEIFMLFSDELADVTWVQAFQMLLQLFNEMLSVDLGLPERKINEMMDLFMKNIPSALQKILKTA